jgi:hypothetical protein
VSVRLALGVLALAALPLLVSCARSGSWGQRPHCPVVPVSTANQLEDVELRARMNFSVEGRRSQFGVIARGAPEELVVVGIAQHGTRLFAVHQRGREIAVEGTSSRKFSYLALWTVDALHRAVWIPAPSQSGAGAVVDWSWENEYVTESVVGRQRRREFTHPGASDAVSIIYASPSMTSGNRIEIQNPWCGYESRFVILDTPERGGR